MMRRALGALALALVLAAPASAMLPVVDVSAIAKIVQQIQQTEDLIAKAKQNLQALQGGVGTLTALGRIDGITQMLNGAQATCRAALAQKTLPAACNVQANTATAQAAQLGADLGQIESIQKAARGSGGALAATQAAAQASLVVASQLQQQRQAQIAADLQKGIDADALSAAKQKPTINPWGP